MTTYSIKKLKTFSSPDGGGFNATLCFGKTQVADLHDGGYGGCIDFTWLDSARNGKVNPNPTFEKDFDDFVAEIMVPEFDYDRKKQEFQKTGAFKPIGAETFINFLIDQTGIKKELRSVLRRKILGYIPNEGLCEWNIKPDMRDPKMFDLFRENQGVEYFLNSEAGVEFDDAFAFYAKWVTREYGMDGFGAKHVCWDHAQDLYGDPKGRVFPKIHYTACSECGRLLAMGAEAKKNDD